VTERVVAIDIGVEWEPSVPAARLVAADDGEARLSLRPHADDEDRRHVELVWAGAVVARMEPPNDEAIDGHRLYAAGLEDVWWIGEVHESQLIADLVRRNEVHERHSPDLFAGLRHWILPLKECVVEVVAESLTVERPGSPQRA